MNRRGRPLEPCRFCGQPRYSRTSVTVRRIPACDACRRNPDVLRNARRSWTPPKPKPEPKPPAAPKVRAPMDYAAIGRLGGAARKQQLGDDGYRELGRKGGKARAALATREDFAEMGRKGGRRVLEVHGREHYRRIGTLGGRRLVVVRGTAHMRLIGRKGGQHRGRRSSPKEATP